MIRASGILFLAPGNMALFLKRSVAGDAAGTWCFPGGKIEGDETPEQAAKREAIEEIGFLPKGDRVLWTRRVGPVPPSNVPNTLDQAPSIVPPPQPPEDVDFTTFVQRVKEEFEPKLDGEHVGYAWAPIDQPPEPLHAGCRISLQRFSLDELGVARAMAGGELASPQFYENMWLFALRVTGTGMSYRNGHDEFVWRTPDVFLSDDFVQRCNGLPVVWEHPKKAVLSSKEYVDRNVGSVFLPYRKGDEVWAIAKIYDEAAAKGLQDEQLSTSPCVVFRDETVNRKLTTEDGERLLIEGKPSLLDHLAICEHGVWDKGGGPTGVDAGMHRGDQDMTTAAAADANAKADSARKDEPGEREEMAERIKEKEAEGKKKADADAGTALDTILKHCDSFAKHNDSMSAKHDAMSKRMDAVEARFAKADAEMCDSSKKKDGDEDVMMDKRKDAARKDEPGEREEMAERIKAKEAEGKKKTDAEDKEEEKKADAALAENAELKARMAKLESRMPKLMNDADYNAMSVAQAKADSVFNDFGQRAPRFMNGETLQDYRLRLARDLQAHSPKLKDVNLNGIADDAGFKVMEDMIYADAAQAARNPIDLPDDQILCIPRRIGGREVNTFVGKRSFIGAMTSPARQVVEIRNRNPQAH